MRRTGRRCAAAGGGRPATTAAASRNRPRGVRAVAFALVGADAAAAEHDRDGADPASRTPRVRLPGRVRTWIRERERRRMEQAFESGDFGYLANSKPRLLFYPRMLYFAPMQSECPIALAQLYRGLEE